MSACHSLGMAETTYSVSLVSADPSKAVDHFYKFRGERLPEEGDIIDVVRFVRLYQPASIQPVRHRPTVYQDHLPDRP